MLVRVRLARPKPPAKNAGEVELALQHALSLANKVPEHKIAVVRVATSVCETPLPVPL
jgi:hypothetical protein